jgi:signal peptidase I
MAWIAAGTGVSFVLIPDRPTAFGYETYYVPSFSMFPTVYGGDRVVADTWRYRDAAPAFGDIVVCDFGDGTVVVKRVVGVPGDTIELRGALLVRNGTPVDEPYSSVERGIGSPDVRPLTLGADEFFVLGDNRGNSNDSRAQGPLARDQIYGRVEFIYFSTAGGGVAWERFPVVLGAD